MLMFATSDEGNSENFLNNDWCNTMVSYEEALKMLEGIVDETPQELFVKLSGGVVMLEESKLHPQSRPKHPLYIMGEYHHDATGRAIFIYYGSFSVVYSYLDSEKFREKLRHTFAHELRHHIERMAGVMDLNKFDDEKLDRYNSGMDIAEFHEPPIGKDW